MFSLAVHDLVVTMTISLFLLGVLAIAAGVVILITRVLSGEMRVMADQTAKLAQKGIAEDIAGLVGNATSLIGALDEILRTTSGIAMFLVLVGFLLVGSAYYLLLQLP